MVTYREQSPPRIEFLKSQLLDQEMQVCSERALLITEADQQFISEPILLKRAKTLHHILSNIHVAILEQELIVGLQASLQRSVPVFPEMDVDWLERELEQLETRPVDRFIVSEKVTSDLKSIIPYWKDRGIRKMLFNSLPSVTKKIRLDAKVFSVSAHEETALGHVILDYPNVLEVGLEGIKEDIQGEINKLALHEQGDVDKYTFYQAALIACDSAMTFANRYSGEAERLAKSEPDAKRKTELKRIASVCRHVPAKPARDFYEALQSLWFIQLIPQIENNGSSYSPGRIDQYLYPFYQNDIESGRLNRSEAQELLDCLWLKLSEPLILYNTEAAKIAGGFPMGQNVTIGGVDKRGHDSTNELSYLCLNAQEHLRLSQPNFTVRVHQKSPTEFLTRVAEVIRIGTGMPQIMSDDVCIPALLNKGLTIQEARDYAPVGCVELAIAGVWGRENGGYLNLVKVLEYTLNNGICRLTGKQNGLPLGYLRDYQTFSELLKAFKQQLKYFIPHLITENNSIDKIHADLVPNPFVAVLVPGCIENGISAEAGGAVYNFTGPTAVGGANVGNSLAAIKKLLYDDNSISAEIFEKALEANYVGYDKVRTLAENVVKYGNDHDYVDLIVKDVIETYADEIERYTNGRGGKFRPGLTAVTAHVGMGKDVGATPDGRLAETTLADGISPFQGTDKSGPTAVINSVTKLDLARFGKGIILNLAFLPMVLSTQKGIKGFIDLVRTYCDLGGLHVQFNVINKETLLDAQKHPENYQNLVVRVAGYSALFVKLSTEVQNQVIARTTHKVIM
jgi:formate C-acetyltransferase